MPQTPRWPFATLTDQAEYDAMRATMQPTEQARREAECMNVRAFSAAELAHLDARDAAYERGDYRTAAQEDVDYLHVSAAYTAYARTLRVPEPVSFAGRPSYPEGSPALVPSPWVERD